MDENDVDGFGQNCQCPRNRNRSTCPSGDYNSMRCRHPLADAGDFVDVGRRCRDHECAKPRKLGDHVEAVTEQRYSGDLFQRLGRIAPRRSPRPAAAITTATDPRDRSPCCDVIELVPAPELGGQHLVEEALSLVFISLFGKREFTDQDLAGLRKHPLLTS